MADFEIIPIKPVPGEATGILRAEQQRSGSVTNYPTYLERMAFWHSNTRRALKGVSEIVEPVDRVLGRDKRAPHADAFYRGSLIGLRVVSLCVDDVDKAFAGISLSFGQQAGEDDEHARHIFAAEIMNIGAESNAAVEDIFLPLFEEWDAELSPDVTLHTYLHSGFGLPLAYLFMREALNDDACYRKERAELQAALSSPQAIDWGDLESFLAEQ